VVVTPLNQLHKNGVKFAWWEEQAFEFQEQKELVAQLPDFSKQFTRIFQTDAYGTTLEVILFQEVEVYRQPIPYASRTLKLDEMKEKSVYKLECWDSLFGICEDTWLPRAQGVPVRNTIRECRGSYHIFDNYARQEEGWYTFRPLSIGVHKMSSPIH
jgi:hypothetical protein